MTVRFQADADFNQRIVAATLRREPMIDFRTATDAGLPGLEDPAVLAVAAADGRVLVSHDMKSMPGHFGDFIIDSTSPGVVIVPQRMPVAVATENLILIWAATEADEWVNRVYIVPSGEHPSGERRARGREYLAGGAGPSSTTITTASQPRDKGIPPVVNPRHGQTVLGGCLRDLGRVHLLFYLHPSTGSIDGLNSLGTEILEPSLYHHRSIRCRILRATAAPG